MKSHYTAKLTKNKTMIPHLTTPNQIHIFQKMNK